MRFNPGKGIKRKMDVAAAIATPKCRHSFSKPSSSDQRLIAFGELLGVISIERRISVGRVADGSRLFLDLESAGIPPDLFRGYAGHNQWQKLPLGHGCRG